MVEIITNNISRSNSHDRVVLFLEYDGARYHGYQMQNESIPTIQMSLENALYDLNKAVNMIPNDSNLHFVLGSISMLVGDFQKATDFFKNSRQVIQVIAWFAGYSLAQNTKNVWTPPPPVSAPPSPKWSLKVVA